ncbi:MAG: hypothetical protein H7061_13215 [Bdellovibrionaceae bacterium]|nr:hypothetical protein [Bdellovibrio sp.]
MKLITHSLFFAILTFISFFAQANSNPQMRECRIRGGEFLAVAVNDDQVGLCQLGSAYIGAIDLMLVVNKEGMPKSVEMYTNGMKKCDPLGKAKTVSTLEGRELQVCFFDDGSAIGLATLHSGMDAPENSRLNQALNFKN